MLIIATVCKKTNITKDVTGEENFWWKLFNMTPMMSDMGLNGSKTLTSDTNGRKIETNN